jgi:hypothetical protein
MCCLRSYCKLWKQELYLYWQGKQALWNERSYKTSENGYVVLDSNQDLNDLNIVVKGLIHFWWKWKI